MRILMVGDVVGRPGRQAAMERIPRLKTEYGVDFVIVNGENAAGGIGILPDIAQGLLHAGGADVITLGNHAWGKREIYPMLDDNPRILRPANYPQGAPGRGWHVYATPHGPVGVIVLQGRTFMEPVDDPFRAVDAILNELRSQTRIVFVDFHAEATSEKQAFGWYVDGRVSAVVGTHTHIQTADDRILSNGTAYLTDVGMDPGRSSPLSGCELKSSFPGSRPGCRRALRWLTARRNFAAFSWTWTPRADAPRGFSACRFRRMKNIGSATHFPPTRIEIWRGAVKSSFPVIFSRYINARFETEAWGHKFMANRNKATIWGARLAVAAILGSAGAAWAQNGTLATLYRGETRQTAGMTVRSLGSGMAEESQNVHFNDGTSSLRITTHGLYQGAGVGFATPVNLSNYLTNRNAFLQFAILLPGTESGGSSFPGGGGRRASRQFRRLWR